MAKSTNAVDDLLETADEKSQPEISKKTEAKPEPKPAPKVAEPEPKKGNDRIIPNPTPKVGVLIKYTPGRKEEAIQEAFELLGDGTGLRVTIGEIGHSRLFEFKRFPKTNKYVPGFEGHGCMFVKYEPLS